jgi:hypothetical protein
MCPPESKMTVHERAGGVLMIRTADNSVYYPVPEERVDVIRGSGRVRYVRRLLLVKARFFRNR